MMKKFNNLAYLASILAILTIILMLPIACEKKGPIRIGITQFTTHPALDAVRRGIEKELESYVSMGKVQIVFRNANADFTAATKIAQEFASLKLDMVVPITTVSAQPIAKACPDIPMVFAGITDPVGAGLIKSLDKPGGKITGSSDLWPFNQQFEVFKKAFPNIRNIGYLYNPGETQAGFALERAKEAAGKQNITLVSRQIDSTNQIRTVALQLAPKVDAYYFGMDNTVAQGLDVLIKAATELRKPLFAGDEDTIRKGGTLAVGVDFEEVGRLAGDMIKEILFQGKKPGDMPVRVVQAGMSFYNREVFENLRVKVPEFLEGKGQDLGVK
jgi:putative ABC transport system substrate-binding protein